MIYHEGLLINSSVVVTGLSEIGFQSFNTSRGDEYIFKIDSAVRVDPISEALVVELRVGCLQVS